MATGGISDSGIDENETDEKIEAYKILFRNRKVSGPGCKAFFLYAAHLLKWGDLSEKVCMDVGCGKGLDSTYRFVKMFPNIAKLIAIDNDIDKLEMAEEIQDELGPKVEFRYGIIDDRSFIEHWENKMQVIVSYRCFDYIRNQEEALRNVYRLLEDGGSAALYFNMWTNYHELLRITFMCRSLYPMVFMDERPESNIRDLHTDDIFTSLLEDIGFEIVHCGDFCDYTVCRNEDEVKTFFLNTAGGSFGSTSVFILFVFWPYPTLVP